MPPVVSGRLAYAIKLAQHCVRLRMYEALRPISLTTPQYGVLCALEAGPGMLNAKLARVLFVTAQTMHGIITNLMRGGLVERARDKQNGKRIAGTLTAEVAVLAEANGLVGQVERRLAESFSADETSQLTKSLMECARRLA